MNRSHPFERYAQFTDVAALKEFSARRLRKSVRVNTIKCSVDRFRAYARENDWKLEDVAWCPESFFIDRDDRGKALGRDVLHLLGHFYMQEAASMLPVTLLDPKPGESILDMSAAPGSKTTQIAARMQGRGVIVANDVQEKRLWTLKSALHRSGVHNVIVTKKVGQWFGHHMTERFDRVLCDAPCTAQGTARKDSDALEYSSQGNVDKMARLQESLLEAAFHAAKIGGSVVYSTCTLTPEENEQVIGRMINKFPDQIEVVDPREIFGEQEWIAKATADSKIVQTWLAENSKPVVPDRALPLLRMWPHVHDVEGFFAAVLRKKAPTLHAEPMDWVPFQEMPVPDGRAQAFNEYLENKFGAPFLDPDEVLFERVAEERADTDGDRRELHLREERAVTKERPDKKGGEELQMTTRTVAEFPLPLRNYSLGLPFGRRIVEGKVRLSNEFASLRAGRATKNVIRLTDDECEKILDGRDIPCDPALDGDCVLEWKGVTLGLSLARDGNLKNRLSRWVVQRS